MGQTVGAILAGDEGSVRGSSHAVLSEALFAACVASRPDDAASILFLLENGGSGEADMRDDADRTPLHHACRRDDIVIAQLLSQAGADPASQDCQVKCSPIIGDTGCRFLSLLQFRALRLEERALSFVPLCLR